MENKTGIKKIKINIAKNENFFDLNLCAKEFIDLIDNFKSKFLNKKYFVLVAYYGKILAGLLVAEDKSQKVNSLENIVPNIWLHLLYVNPNYRNNSIGKRLVNTFLMLSKKKGYAAIYIKLPNKYKKGITFFLNNEFLGFKFRQRGKMHNKIILELHLWNDYGIRDCQIIKIDSFALY
ncbi:MAG: GNAT family N-acetyltransferase [Candidatus Lokiarchaeota archaeon]|nr:GNAT family N-acetyltransferase [Candidatus Lokiarchaeota archaeon]